MPIIYLIKPETVRRIEEIVSQFSDQEAGVLIAGFYPTTPKQILSEVKKNSNFGKWYARLVEEDRNFMKKCDEVVSVS